MRFSSVIYQSVNSLRRIRALLVFLGSKASISLSQTCIKFTAPLGSLRQPSVISLLGNSLGFSSCSLARSFLKTSTSLSQTCMKIRRARNRGDICWIFHKLCLYSIDKPHIICYNPNRKIKGERYGEDFNEYQHRCGRQEAGAGVVRGAGARFLDGGQYLSEKSDRGAGDPLRYARRHAETVAAIEEGRRMAHDPNATSYGSVAEMRKALGL